MLLAGFQNQKLPPTSTTNLPTYAYVQPGQQQHLAQHHQHTTQPQTQPHTPSSSAHNTTTNTTTHTMGGGPTFYIQEMDLLSLTVCLSLLVVGTIGIEYGVEMLHESCSSKAKKKILHKVRRSCCRCSNRCSHFHRCRCCCFHRYRCSNRCFHFPPVPLLIGHR